MSSAVWNIRNLSYDLSQGVQDLTRQRLDSHGFQLKEPATLFCFVYLLSPALNQSRRMDLPVATETSSLLANRVDQSLRDVINHKVCRPPSSLTHATTAVLRKASEDIGVIAAINVAKRQEVLLCVREQLQPPRRLPPLAQELVLPGKSPVDSP